MHRYELVLSREVVGRLLALAEEGRPACLSASRVQGPKKHRLCVWQVVPSPPPAAGEGWLEIASPRDFLAGFDMIKVFSDRGIRVITTGRPAWSGTTRRASGGSWTPTVGMIPFRNSPSG